MLFIKVKIIYLGFHKVVSGKVKNLFTAFEIQTLICGNEFLDFEALENNTEYEGYTKDCI
jgi:hypothetical protein